MNILITGKLEGVSYSFCDVLSEHSQLVASSDDINLNYIGKISKAYTHAIGDDEFTRLFNVHTFDSAIFFIGEVEQSNPDFTILEKLDEVFMQCAAHDIKKIIVVSSTYIYNGNVFSSEENDIEVTDNAGVLLESCKALCNSYRTNRGLEIISLYAPCLFGRGENKTLIGKMVHQCKSKNHISVDGQKNQLVDVLALDDLGEIVSRIMLEWPQTKTEFVLPGAKTMTLSQLCELFKDKTLVTRITYANKPYAAGPPCKSMTVKNEYDWLPVVNIETEIDDLADCVVYKENQQETVWQKISSYVFSKKFIIIAIEIAFGYIVMEIINNITSTAVQFKYVDFRLLYVVLIAIVHGLAPGIAASLLASVSILSAYVASGVEASSIVYNIDRWLPFACYIMIGTIVGYVKNKKDKNITALDEENQHLEKRYAFLIELYDNALSNKDQYKRQIISYRNSFGRIFDVTRKLNTLLPDSVFKEALLTLEDVLDNQTISIYNTYGNRGFARLCVCSKKIIENTPKSIRLSDFDEALNALKKDEVWSNTERLQGYPDYIFPVFNEDNLVSLIMVNKVTFDQMTMYYENLIKILCNLIEDSLVRALEYVEKIGDELYISGSNVMNKDSFARLLKIREDMERDAIAEFSILRFYADEESIVNVADELRTYFRNNDVFGQGEDDNLYVILSGTGQDAIGKVTERLNRNGIDVEVI